MDALSAEQRQVAHAWALWVTESILERLDDEGIVDVGEDAFADAVIAVLQDIAESNAVHRVGTEGGG